MRSERQAAGYPPMRRETDTEDRDPPPDVKPQRDRTATKLISLQARVCRASPCLP